MRLLVVYIAGYGRSGSTIVDRLLGTLEGVASFNEVRRLADNGFASNAFCSCGERFRSCPFWRQFVSEVFPQESEIHRFVQLYREIEHNRNFLSIYSGCYSAEFGSMLEQYRKYLHRIYHALGRLSGCKVLVDSSKSPTRALIVAGMEGIQTHVVHLIRDPRAIVHAWQKKKYDPGIRALMPRYNPSRTILYWCAVNIFCEMLTSRFTYSRIRYEDFVASPETILQSLIDNCRFLHSKRLTFDHTGLVYLNSIHSISGNPQRFGSGLTSIAADYEYKDKLNHKVKTLSTMLAFPFLKRYGYPLRMK